VADAAINAFAGTGKPYIQISGLWVYGANSSISEESPFDPPAMVSWREPIERRVLGASGMRGIVIVSGVAYGDGAGGIPGLLLGSPRDNAGNLIMLGTGRQHWATVHVADLADFFRRVLEHDSARGYYVIGDGLNPTAAELTEAAAVAAGAPGAVPGSDDEARARLGDYFAAVLLLDQGTVAAKAPSRARLAPLAPRTRRRVPPRELRDRCDAGLNDSPLPRGHDMSSQTTQQALPTGTWSVDKIHSTVGFALKYMAGTFQGTVSDFGARLDDGVFSGSAEVASIQVKDPNLETHLQSPDFFDAERFPQLSFLARDVSHVGDDLTMRGELTLKGHTEPVEITGHMTNPAPDPFGGERLGLQLEATIDRTEFGLNWNNPLPSGDPALANDVTIIVDLQLVKEA